MIQNIQKKYLYQLHEEETCFLAIYFQKFQSRYYDNQKRLQFWLYRMVMWLALWLKPQI